MPELIDAEFVENNDPRNPCILLLDTSMSMQGPRIAALNAGLQRFKQELMSDPIASRRVEVAVVTFGNNGVQSVQEFVTADSFHLPTLSANHDTPMPEAIERGLGMVAPREEQSPIVESLARGLILLEERKRVYRLHGIDYARPWVIFIVDGYRSDECATIVSRVQEELVGKSAIFFALAVKRGAVKLTTPIVPWSSPLASALNAMDFDQLFVVVSRGQRALCGGTLLPPTKNWCG